MTNIRFSFMRNSAYAAPWRNISGMFIMLVCLLSATPLWGNGHYSFMHADYNVGLSSSNVKCIAGDSYGFVWLGTKNGLHRFDGINARRLRCYDYARQQGNDNIGALYEDENKKLWVGTDRGVYLYNPVSDRFTFMDMKDPVNGVSADNWVGTIDGDHHGNVWVLLPDKGVFRYKGKNVSFYSVLPAESMKEKFPSALCVDENGDVWAATTGQGLYRFNHRRNRFDKVVAVDGQTLDGLYLSNVCVDTDGSLIIASSNGIINRYTPQNNKFTRIKFSVENDSPYLRSLLCLENEIWVGTQHGLYIINKTDGSEKILHKDPLNGFSLSDDIIYCMYKSRSGDVWVGTFYGGADYMPRNKFTFQVYGTWSGLGGRVVNGIAQARDNNIWIGTEDGGMYVLNPKTQAIKPVTTSSLFRHTSLMLNAYNNCIYAGFSRGGLVRIDDGGKVSPVLDIKESDNSVYAYFKDSHGNEWVGLGYALYRRDAGTDSFVRVNETGYDWIFSIFEAHDGVIWIATMGNGLWRYTPATGKYKSYTSDQASSGLRSNSISALMEDSRGNIWVSTDRGGISRYDRKNDNFVTYGINEGLPDNVVYNILEDKRGNLWFGTNKGLVKFNPDTKAVKVFTVKDGLPGNQFNYNSAIRANDGMFYFGCIGGVVVFNPELEESYAPASSLYFTRLQVFNELITTNTENSPLKQSIMFTDKLVLPYDMATFSLEAVSPEFGAGGSGVYSYRIEPGNGEWIRMIDNRVSFTNLQPGTYKLCVRVDNHGQTARKEMTIVICPPWWQSVWAYIIYILLLGAVVGRWFVWYREHKERQMRERQRLYAISKEKELYQNKVNFFTEVAHEIRTPLTLIDAPLEAIEEIGTRNQRIAHYLKVMRQNTRRLLNLTGQLLDFQKLGSNRMSLKFENVDIVALVNETVDRFDPTIQLRKKTLTRNITFDEPLVASVDREAVTKILSNLLNNALKYARHNINVTLAADDSSFAVSVASDGTKISKDDEKHIFEPFYQIDKSNSGENGVGIGLPLSLSLARLLGGSLTLDANDNVDNTFVMRIPLNKEGVEQNNLQTMESPDYVLADDTNQVKDEPRGYTVLIVEDNDSMREFIAEQVNMMFTVETACNGKEALQRLAASKIDIIVSDVMMPEMDGFELCKTVKTDLNLSHIPLVFITAKNDLDSKIKGLKLGAEAYIEKPFSIKYFRQLIQSLLENRQRERESFQKKPFFTVENMHMPKADEDFMKKVIQIIEDHVGEENFNVETMANILCMSHSSLLRKIKIVFNMSPVELIRTVKLKKAAELIQEGKYLIGDICYMVGISSPSYFSKIFFAQFGISPKDFERQNRKKNK